MNCINQHIDGINQVEFETTEDLLDIPFVKNMKKLPGFERFSVDKRYSNLMCETNDKWYVIGELNHTDEIDLPEWKSPSHYFTYPSC